MKSEDVGGRNHNNLEESLSGIRESIFHTEALSSARGFKRMPLAGIPNGRVVLNKTVPGHHHPKNSLILMKIRK